MTGRPSNETYAGPRPPELAGLRTFCMFNAVLYFVVALLIVAMRPLIALWMDEGRIDVELPLLAQELLCAISLICLAALLLSVRSAIGRGAPDLRGALRWARLARRGALAIGAVVLLGLGAALLAAQGYKFPTGAVSVFVLFAAMWTHVGARKLPR